MDALPGCGTSFLLKPHFRVEHYKEHNKWDQVTHYYALQVPNAHGGAVKELLDSFKRSCLYQVPLLCSSKTVEPQYECLWRLGQWDTGEKGIEYFTEKVTPDDFEKFRFLSLKALHENNHCAFDDAKKSQSLCVVEKLKETSLESSENIYPILSQLKGIVETEDFSVSCITQSFTSTVTKWISEDKILKRSNFVYVEPIITQRLAMLSDYLLKKEDADVKKYFIDATLNFAGICCLKLYCNLFVFGCFC